MPGGGTDSFLWVLGLFSAGEALEAAVLYPVVLGKETGLHAVTVVVVLLAAGWLLLRSVDEQRGIRAAAPLGPGPAAVRPD